MFDNFTYLTKIDKLVQKLILHVVSLVDTGVSANGPLMWEKAEVPGENPGIHLMKIRMVNLSKLCFDYPP